MNKTSAVSYPPNLLLDLFFLSTGISVMERIPSLSENKKCVCCIKCTAICEILKYCNMDYNTSTMRVQNENGL